MASSTKDYAVSTKVPADVANPATTTAAATNVAADIADPATTDPYKDYTPLLDASIRGEWESAEKFIESDPNAATAAISKTNETALITAVRAGQFKFAEKLLQLMPQESLLHKDSEEFTVLHYAATRGNLNTTRMLVMKCPNLTQIRNRYDETPLLRATIFGEEEIVWYLLTVTTDDQEHSPFRGKDGAHLLNVVIQVDLYDVALHLVQKYPEMVWTEDKNGRHAIRVLAAKYWRSRTILAFLYHFN